MSSSLSGMCGSWQTDFRKWSLSFVFFPDRISQANMGLHNMGRPCTRDPPASAYHVLRLCVYHCGLWSCCSLSLVPGQSPQGQHHAHSLFRMTSAEMKNTYTYVGLKHLNLNDPPKEINCTHIMKSGKFCAIRGDIQP